MPSASLPNLIPALPELFLVCMAMALLMLGVFQKAGVKGEDVKTGRFVSTRTPSVASSLPFSAAFVSYIFAPVGAGRVSMTEQASDNSY